jgi:small subunit ribosomal protein S21
MSADVEQNEAPAPTSTVAARSEEPDRRPSSDRRPSGGGGERRRDYGGGHRQGTLRRPQALAVVVDDRGIESALRAFKRMVLKEGLLKDLKRRQYFEKPSDRLRRKRREAVRRRRRQEARARRPWGAT